MSDATSRHVQMSFDGWRWLLAAALIIAPIYGWLLFYRISTGDVNHDAEFVMSRSPLLATFAAPLLLAVRVVGWRSWRWVIVAIVTVLLAATLPHSLSQELLPGSYLAALLTLGVLTFGARLGAQILRTADAAGRYSRQAVIIQSFLLVVCVVLLLPLSFSS